MVYLHVIRNCRTQLVPEYFVAAQTFVPDTVKGMDVVVCPGGLPRGIRDLLIQILSDLKIPEVEGINATA